MYIMHIKKFIEWNAEKAEILRESRGIDFNELANKIKSGDYKIIPVDNQIDHKGQNMFLVEIDNYIHCVPFVEDDNSIFLKTAFRSRKHQKENL